MKKLLFTLFGLMPAVLVLAYAPAENLAGHQDAKTATFRNKLQVLEECVAPIRTKLGVIVAAQGYTFQPQDRLPLNTGKMVAMPKPPCKK